MYVNRRRNIRAALQTLAIILGNSVGIWLSYFLIEFYFKGINPNISFPGFETFLIDGTLMVITFSFLTTVLVSMSNRLKHNFYNISAIVLLIVSAIIYSRFIGLGSKVEKGELIKAWYLWVPFIISAILLFFSVKNQKSIFRKHSWLKGAKNDDFDYSVFLSFAIAGNKTKKQREVLMAEIKLLEKKLVDLGYAPNFNASNYFSDEHEFQQPEIAAREDFNAIEKCRNFILYYPEKVPTSALIELGYALRDRDNILICSKDKHTLPFLARGLSALTPDVKILECDTIERLIKTLEEHHETYLKK